MDVEAADEGSQQGMHVRARHIKKRALKNKSVSVSFNEKDLKDYVTGFHKRKKKRRKEARQQQDAADRRKRIEQRKKRKLEREAVYGGAPADSGANAAEFDDEHEDSEETEPLASVSGTTLYDNGDMQVTVRTSEITREEDYPVVKLEPGNLPQSVEGIDKTKQKIPVIKRKPINKNAKKRSRPKLQSKREKRKGNMKNKKPY